jgi:hypothetical protein
MSMTTEEISRQYQLNRYLYTRPGHYKYHTFDKMARIIPDLQESVSGYVSEEAARMANMIAAQVSSWSLLPTEEAS